MRKPETQEEAVLFHFLQGGSLTALEAHQRRFGYCTRLSARVFDFRKMGLVIESETVTKKTIFKTYTTFEVFFIDFNKTPKGLIKKLMKKYK